MDIGFAFTYPFKDENWFKKLILLGLVSLIPIVGSLVLLGALAQIIKRYVNNDPVLLPDLDFGTQLTLGFKLFVVGLGYALPAIIIQIPAQILPSVVGMNSKGSNDTLMTIVTILTSCCVGIVALYNIFIAFVLPIAYAKVAMEETIGAGFKFGDIFSILKSNFLNYLIVLLVSGIAGGLIFFAGLIVCLVGIILALPYIIAMEGNLYAQAYKVALAKQPMP
jgi:hypothetical protein